MKKLNLKLNLLIKLIILLFLVLSGLSLAVIFNSGTALSAITVSESGNELRFSNTNQLYKGDSLTGVFTAKNNYLGIIYLKFDNVKNLDYYNQSDFIFRIKKDGDKSWYAVNKYKSGIIYNNNYFPFGFPPIRNSQNHQFVFQIISLNGNKTNFIKIDTSVFNFAASYIIPKSEITSNISSLAIFFIRKAFYSLNNPYFVLNSLKYFIPALFYFIWITLLNRFTQIKYSLSLISITMVILDIVFLNDIYSGILLGAVGLWIWSVVLYKLEYSLSILVSLLLILLGTLTLNIANPSMTDKISTWGYLFFVSGIGLAIYQSSNTKSNYITMRRFLKDLSKI